MYILISMQLRDFSRIAKLGEMQQRENICEN